MMGHAQIKSKSGIMNSIWILKILYQHETNRLVKHSRLILFLYPSLMLISALIFLTIFAYPLTPLASPLVFFDLISLMQFFILPYLAILGFSQEKSQRTHWTLLAWPIKSSQIIYAKFLAWLRIALCSLLLCAFWLIAGTTWYSYDPGLIITGIVQVMMTASLTLALTMYFSTRLIRNSWYAVFMTQGCLLAWLFCDFLLRKWQILGNITALLQVFTYGYYTAGFQKGLLSTGMCTFFLGITIFLLRKSWKAVETYRGQAESHARLILPILWALTLFFPIRLDISLQGMSRLHSFTYKMLYQVHDPLYITYYYSDQHKFNKDIMAVQEQLRLYGLANSWVVLRNKPLKDTKEAQAQGLYDQNGLFAGVLIEYLDKAALIPLLLDADEVEYQVTSKLYQILYGRRKLLVRAGVMQNIEDYSLFIQALSRHFDVQTWIGNKMPAADGAIIFSASGLNNSMASDLFNAYHQGMGLFIGYSGVGVPTQEDKKPIRYGTLPASSYFANLGIRAGADLVLDPEGFYFSGQSLNGNLIQQIYPAWPKGFGSKNLLWRMVLPIFCVPLWPDETWKALLFSSPAVGVQEGIVNIDPLSLQKTPLPAVSGPYILMAEKEGSVPLIVSGSETIFSDIAPTLQNYIAGELLAWKLVGLKEMAELKLYKLRNVLMKRPYSPILDTGRFILQVLIFLLVNIAFIIFCILRRRKWSIKAASH